MQIQIRIAGFISGKVVNEGFEFPVEEGETLSSLFRRLDKQEKMGKKFFKGILNADRPPVILLSGTRLDIKKDIDRLLNDGDEIAILTPIAGG